MSAGDFGFLADPRTTHRSVERLSFRARSDREASVEQVQRLVPPADAAAVGLLKAADGPADAGILRGTAASPPRDLWDAMLIVSTTSGSPPVPLAWSPAGDPERMLSTFRLHRSLRSEVSPDLAKLVVAVDIDFEPGRPDRRGEWVELVLAAIRTDPVAPAGLITAHFHLSDDATRVLNLALWADEAAYDAALSSGPPGIAQSDTEQWRHVLSFPGIRRNTVTRYTSVVRPSSS